MNDRRKKKTSCGMEKNEKIYGLLVRVRGDIEDERNSKTKVK